MENLDKVNINGGGSHFTISCVNYT